LRRQKKLGLVGYLLLGNAGSEGKKSGEGERALTTLLTTLPPQRKERPRLGFSYSWEQKKGGRKEVPTTSLLRRKKPLLDR